MDFALGWAQPSIPHHTGTRDLAVLRLVSLHMALAAAYKLLCVLVADGESV